MSYLLDATEIARPTTMREETDVQFAQNRTLSGAINRDHFGDSKRRWMLEYSNKTKADYDVIKTIYDAYVSSENTVTWEVTETNYTISSVNVHVDLETRDFRVPGTDYISDFTLILTEA